MRTPPLVLAIARVLMLAVAFTMIWGASPSLAEELNAQAVVQKSRLKGARLLGVANGAAANTRLVYLADHENHWWLATCTNLIAGGWICQVSQFAPINPLSAAVGGIYLEK